MKKLLVTLLLVIGSQAIFADSDRIGKPVPIEECNGKLELLSIKPKGAHARLFSTRYFLKFTGESESESDCVKLVIYIGGETQSINIQHGMILSFSNKTMSAYLDKKEDNLIINFLSINKRLISSYVIEDEIIKIND